MRREEVIHMQQVRGRLPKPQHELQDDTLENVCAAALGQDQAQETISQVDKLAKRLIDAAEDARMTVEELTECLRGLAQVRRCALKQYQMEQADEEIGRRICANTEIVIRTRRPLGKAALTQQVRV